MNVLSLFSGIGGFDLGFQRAGMNVIGMCEIDKHAQKVLQRHFPDATLHTDVREVHYERGTVDVICGGFPCQDLSVAGKRRGLAGERSGLWHEFARIIDETEPAWVVIENVPGLFSSAGGRDFAVIIQWLAQRGYGVGWRVLDAQGFGLAQRRKRVFIVGSFGNPSGCTILLEPESVQGNYQSSGKTGKSHSRTAQNSTRNGIAFTLRGTSGIQNGDGAINTNIVPDTIAQTLTTSYGKTWYHDTATFLPDTTSTPVAYTMREDAQANTFHITETDVSLTLQALQPATTSHHAQMLISTSVQDVSPTLRSETKQSLMSGGGNINVPLAIAYSIDSASSNSWKSSNPNSGIHSANVARTIDAAGTNPTSNQGGNLIASVSPQEQSFTAFQQNTRSEVRLMQEDGSVVGALSASAGMNQQNYVLWEASHGYDPARVSSNQGIVPTLSHKMGTGGNNVPLIGVRRLTPTECEALQGFPRNWTSGQSDTQRYRQLGNAVAVPVAEWIGKRILKQH